MAKGLWNLKLSQLPPNVFGGYRVSEEMRSAAFYVRKLVKNDLYIMNKSEAQKLALKLGL